MRKVISSDGTDRNIEVMQVRRTLGFFKAQCSIYKLPPFTEDNT